VRDQDFIRRFTIVVVQLRVEKSSRTVHMCVLITVYNCGTHHTLNILTVLIIFPFGMKHVLLQPLV